MTSPFPSSASSYKMGHSYQVIAIAAAVAVAATSTSFLWMAEVSNAAVIGTSGRQMKGASPSKIVANRLDSPSLELVQGVLASTASADFAGNASATYNAAHEWYEQRLLRADGDTKAPHLVCSEYASGQAALTSLTQHFSATAVHPVANSERHGSCFLVTVSVEQSVEDVLSETADDLSLVSTGPLLPMMKIAPGIFEHPSSSASPPPNANTTSNTPLKLRTRYGAGIQLGNVRGLSVRLSPGILPHRDSSAVTFLKDLQTELTSGTFNMHRDIFWSDPAAPRGANGEHVASDSLEGAVRVHEWTRAADVVHGLAVKNGTTAGEVCGLGRARMSYVDSDLFIIEGIDHLLPADHSSEATMACFMGLVSHLAAKPSVLRVAPLHGVELLDEVVNAIVESGNIDYTPFQDAGLDGSGEVIQVVDTGLDETSCFFADDTGGEVEHGYLFDGIEVDATTGYPSAALGKPWFPYDMSRRKVVQYIELFKVRREDGGQDTDEDDTDSFAYFSDYVTNFGSTLYDGVGGFSYSYNYMSDPIVDPICADIDPLSYKSSTFVPSSSTGGFDKDTAYNGHGTFAAGIAAGAISPNSPYLTQNCSSTEELPGCVGGCISSSDVDLGIANGLFDIDLFCPMYDCDNYGAGLSYSYEYCLGDDPLETLAENSGVAPGAQIAVFDAGYFGGDFFGDLFIFLAGNFLWTSTYGTGTRIHSNSWGAVTNCEVTEFEYLFETYMRENPESLLIFAAGNSGGVTDVYTYDSCFMFSPAIGKNILAVGASSTGPARATTTGVDGQFIYESYGLTNYTADGYPYICLFTVWGTPSTSTEQADIDTVAYFSSSGPTRDGRIKPELVAPGDQVFSSSSDGTDEYTCQLRERLSAENNSIAFNPRITQETFMGRQSFGVMAACGAGLGTSVSCPVVAGSAALVRQYFLDEKFFARDIKTRHLCDRDAPYIFQCGSFSPSAVTVKAMLINSANLMGGSTEPDNSRGFGRVHLAAGMPMDGMGHLSLLVADSSRTTIDAFGVNKVDVKIDGEAGLELRVTLCWFDPPTTALSAIQLQHDLDLVVVSPSGARYTMWESGDADSVNVIERVIVPAASTMDGMWTISVSAGGLLFDKQSYSLVITGAIVGYQETRG